MSQFDELHVITEQINALNDRTWATRKQAVNTLIALGKPAVMPLITAIRQHFFGVFTLPRAIEALGAIGDAQAVELLIETLKSNHVHAAQEAAKGLRYIGDPRASPE